LRTSRECLCTVCLLQYNMHGGGGVIISAVQSKAKALHKKIL